MGFFSIPRRRHLAATLLLRGRPALHWTPGRAMLVLVLGNFIFAGTNVASKDAMRVLTPIELNTLRTAIAAIVLSPVLWTARRSIHVGMRDLWQLAPLCLSSFVLSKILAIAGLNLTTASDASLLMGAEVLFTSIMAWVFLREAVRRHAVVGLILGAIGIYVVVTGGLGCSSGGSGTRLAGDLLVLAGILCEAAFNILGKTAVKRWPPLFLVAACVVGSLIFWIPAGAADVAVSGLPRMTPGAWAGVLYLGVAATALGYVMWLMPLQHVDVGSAAMTLALQPLLGTVLADVLLGEHPVLSTVVGGACIVTAMLVAGRDTGVQAGHRTRPSGAIDGTLP